MKLPALLSAAWVLTIIVPRAHGDQPGVGMLDPWQEGRLAETYDNPMVEFDGHIKGTDEKTRLFLWESYGRVRFMPDNPRSPVVGYRLLTADFGYSTSALPNGMNDVALAVGAPILDFDGWTLSAIGGAGYAGDTPFGDGDAWYGIGHLVMERPLNDSDRLAFTLDYHGNRALFPDVPLPGVRYIHTTDELAWTVGFPSSEMRWRPDPRWTLTATYEVPFTAEARLAYDIGSGWSVYGQFSNFFQPFVFAGDPDDRGVDRWFYQMRRVEVGVRFMHGRWIDAALGVGYAFDQTLERGFDARSRHRQASFTDGPYIGLTLLGSF